MTPQEEAEEARLRVVRLALAIADLYAVTPRSADERATARQFGSALAIAMGCEAAWRDAEPLFTMFGGRPK